MRLLSIETSCDETAAAVLKWDAMPPVLLSSVVSSQIALHAKWGGVVPDLAAREHTKNIVPVIEQALSEAGLTPKDIDGIAVTEGPGLMPALLVGVTAAKTLALVWNKPLIGINHLEGHIYANFLTKISEISNFQFPISNEISNSKNEKLRIDSKFVNQNSTFPLIALIVSGGHTMLVLMRDHFQYELLGETQDDAAGEAFDKVARMLGLPYPGGPVVAKRADDFRHRHSERSEESRNIKQDDIKNEIPRYARDDNNIRFPRPMLHSNDYDFSFSGLKTAVLYFLKKHEDQKTDERFIDEVCHEFQEAAVDVLVEKSRRAILEYQPRAFTIAGGVSANVRLRERLTEMIARDFANTTFLVPEFAYSLDNAAMIGAAAAYRLSTSLASDGGKPSLDAKLEKLKRNAFTLEPDANLPLK